MSLIIKLYKNSYKNNLLRYYFVISCEKKEMKGTCKHSYNFIIPICDPRKFYKKKQTDPIRLIRNSFYLVSTDKLYKFKPEDNEFIKKILPSNEIIEIILNKLTVYTTQITHTYNYNFYKNTKELIEFIKNNIP